MSSTVKANIITILVVGLVAAGNAEDCVPRDFGYGSVVCVCNSTYCDSASVDVPDKGQYQIYESSQSGKRFSPETGSFSDSAEDDNNESNITVTLNPNKKFQQIHGFGGAFTDAAGINIKKLSEAAQNNIITSYFGANGSRYSLGRVPIASSDFSTSPYSYDERNRDRELKKFAIAKEDFEYKIPFMQQALKLSPNLRFVSAAWSAPPWMKTNKNITGYGFLKTEYYKTFANYILNFLLEYKKQGLKIWAVSTGNEPHNVVMPEMRFNSMGWTPKTMAKWVAHNLGPTIARSASNDTLIIIHDDQRLYLPEYVDGVYNYPGAKKYIAGAAVHWYYDAFTGTFRLDYAHAKYPDKFILMTEACVGANANDYPKVRLGDWQRGEQYIYSIIDNLNHWVTGWMDWNMVLDKQGGPNWVNNYVDSPIIVNPETDEFFKQPTYYALAHFSKFVPPGSTRIELMGGNDDLLTIAFLTPNDEIVVVVYNRVSEEKVITISDPDQGDISITMPAFTIKTIIYKR